MYSDCSDGDIRLVGGNTDNEGNVQICYNNAWGSVCDDNWGIADTNVACQQLGFKANGITYLYHYIDINYYFKGLISTIIIITLEFPVVPHIYMEKYLVPDLNSY